MATDKSLNIRQVKAAEQTAGDIAEIKAQILELKAQMAEFCEALLAPKPEPAKPEAGKPAAKK